MPPPLPSSCPGPAKGSACLTPDAVTGFGRHGRHCEKCDEAIKKHTARRRRAHKQDAGRTVKLRVINSTCPVAGCTQLRKRDGGGPTGRLRTLCAQHHSESVAAAFKKKKKAGAAEKAGANTSGGGGKRSGGQQTSRSNKRLCSKSLDDDDEGGAGAGAGAGSSSSSSSSSSGSSSSGSSRRRRRGQQQQEEAAEATAEESARPAAAAAAAAEEQAEEDGDEDKDEAEKEAAAKAAKEAAAAAAKAAKEAGEAAAEAQRKAREAATGAPAGTSGASSVAEAEVEATAEATDEEEETEEEEDEDEDEDEDEAAAAAAEACALLPNADNQCYVNCPLRLVSRGLPVPRKTSAHSPFYYLRRYLAGCDHGTNAEKAAGKAVATIQRASSTAQGDQYHVSNLCDPGEFLDDMFGKLGDSACESDRAIAGACRTIHVGIESWEGFAKWDGTMKAAVLPRASRSQLKKAAEPLPTAAPPHAKVSVEDRLTAASGVIFAYNGSRATDVMIIHAQTHTAACANMLPRRVPIDNTFTDHVTVSQRMYTVIGFVQKMQKSAHYTCYVRSRRDAKRWLYFDDLERKAGGASDEQQNKARADATLIVYSATESA